MIRSARRKRQFPKVAVGSKAWYRRMMREIADMAVRLYGNMFTPTLKSIFPDLPVVGHYPLLYNPATGETVDTTPIFTERDE